jgi:hypothetical protein
MVSGFFSDFILSDIAILGRYLVLSKQLLKYYIAKTAKKQNGESLISSIWLFSFW